MGGSPSTEPRRQAHGYHHPLQGVPGLEQETGEGWVLRIPERDLDAPEQEDAGAESAEGYESNEWSS